MIGQDCGIKEDREKLKPVDPVILPMSFISFARGGVWG
jgi:hypothetical protein